MNFLLDSGLRRNDSRGFRNNLYETSARKNRAQNRSVAALHEDSSTVLTTRLAIEIISAYSCQRSTLCTTSLLRKFAIMLLRCLVSRTSISSNISKKSVE